MTINSDRKTYCGSLLDPKNNAMVNSNVHDVWCQVERFSKEWGGDHAGNNMAETGGCRTCIIKISIIYKHFNISEIL